MESKSDRARFKKEMTLDRARVLTALGSLVILAGCAREPAPKLEIRMRNYVPTASDPTPEQAIAFARAFMAKIPQPVPLKIRRLSTYKSRHSDKRPAWSVGFESSGVELDMETRTITRFAEGQRDRWELRGDEPKRAPAVPERDAKQYVERLAHRLGVPETMRFSAFGCSHMGGHQGNSLVCGGKFKDAEGNLIAYIKVDLFDGGLHAFEFYPWRLKEAASPSRKGQVTGTPTAR